MEISVGLIGPLILLVFACHAVTGAPNEMGKMDVYSASGRLQLPEVLVATPISVSYKVEVNPTGWRQPAQKGVDVDDPISSFPKSDISISLRKPKSVSDVASKVKNIIAQKLGVDVGQVTDNATLVEDLGADSLEMLEIAVAIEQEFGCGMSEDDVQKINRVIDLVNFVNNPGCISPP